MSRRGGFAVLLQRVGVGRVAGLLPVVAPLRLRFGRILPDRCRADGLMGLLNRRGMSA